MFSGRTNYEEKAKDKHTTGRVIRVRHDTRLVQLVTQIYRVDIIAFQVREHDNLLNRVFSIRKHSSWYSGTYEEDHAEQQSSSHEDRKQEQPACFVGIGFSERRGSCEQTNRTQEDKRRIRGQLRGA
jgi:hypothetical protein